MNDDIRQLILSLLELDLADKLIVFGSVAAGSDDPKDLDVVFDARECEYQIDAIKKHGDALRQLISLSRRHYGYLDPFILTQKHLYVRNDHATGWQVAKNKRGLLSAIKNGSPLASISVDYLFEAKAMT